jgi:hypothetical protein
MPDRDEFECWAVEQGWSIRKAPSGMYYDQCAEGAWATWQHRQDRIDALTDELTRLREHLGVGNRHE